MAFIQIIEFKTSKAEETQKLDQEWERATEGKRTVRRSIATRDRNDPTHHMLLAFFDSFESAMENSALPETQEFAARYAEVIDGPMTFHDLDVIEDHS
ncbi:MAG TPA: hypothetical protein VN781_00685 [Acidimicrobiales bacterium]|nr:hypothetical protein [Acidimicrobiales bacterium]